jgi:pimeloyl-ACP methyl ester carboxylesterase
VTGVLNRISVNGTELEYELRGTGAGESVVLIHWGVGAKWAEPLLEQQVLTSRYQLLSYHRAGFAGSGRLEGQPTMAVHAAHCHQLMRELGITRAHIVGHSSSVPVALQLALDAPDAAHTLTLMEAARPAAPTDAERQFGMDVALAAVQRRAARPARPHPSPARAGPRRRRRRTSRLLCPPPDSRTTLITPGADRLGSGGSSPTSPVRLSAAAGLSAECRPIRNDPG